MSQGSISLVSARAKQLHNDPVSEYTDPISTSFAPTLTVSFTFFWSNCLPVYENGKAGRKVLLEFDGDSD